MKIKLLFFAFALTLTSCWKVIETGPIEPPVDPNGSLVDTDAESFEFEIPEDFDWENFRVVKSSVTIYNRYGYNVEYGVQIYDGEDMIDAGITKNGVYNSSFAARRGASRLSVRQIDPLGNSARVFIDLDGSDLRCDFNSMFAVPAGTRAVEYSNDAVTDVPVAPAIPADAVEVTEGMVLEAEGVYCISAGNTISNVKIDNASGAKIYIAGEYNAPAPSWFDGKSECFSIYVLESGKFTSTMMYSSLYKNLIIENYGEFTTFGEDNGKVQISGTLKNVGKLSIGEGAAELFLLEDSTFENYGELKAGRLGLSKGVTVKNYGEVEIKNDVWTQYGDVFKLFENRNHFVAGGQIQLTDGEKVDNYHRIESAVRVNIHGVGEVVLNPYSMIKAPEMNFQRTSFISKGDAIIKIANSLSVDYSTTFVGSEEKPSVIYGPDGNPHIWFPSTSNLTDKWILDPDPNIWAANWGPDIVLGNNGYVIAATPSNDGGYNSEPIDETPGDVENIDFATTPKIVIFEDNYPNMGDCDFNDIVMQWNLRGEKDANDIVKDLYIDVIVKSCGAGRKVGAGVRIHSLASSVLGATIEADDLSKHKFDKYFAPKNGVEADVNGVVVPLFESIHSLFGLELGNFINVSNDESERCEYYKFSVKLELDEDMTSSNLNLDNFDFFVVTGTNEKGRAEIHTFGNDVSLYANNEISFKNPSAVWGVELPKEFLYSVEHQSIVLAYPSFQTWIESAGNSNDDWYKYSQEGLVVRNN